MSSVRKCNIILVCLRPSGISTIHTPDHNAMIIQTKLVKNYGVLCYTYEDKSNVMAVIMVLFFTPFQRQNIPSTSRGKLTLNIPISLP